MTETTETRPMKYKAGQPVDIVAMRNQVMGRTAWIGLHGVIEQVMTGDDDQHPYLVDVPGHGRIWVHEDDLEAAD